MMQAQRAMERGGTVIARQDGAMRASARGLSVVALCVLACVALAGCQLVGGMVENYRKDSTHLIGAQYGGLKGKSVAVLLIADRTIQGQNPGLVEHLTTRITERLSDAAITPTPSGFIPASQVLKYQSRHPDWASKPFDELCTDLGGVDRIVTFEVFEYRLTDPGNPYEWNGVAAGSVRVIERENTSLGGYGFEKSVSVKFPDKSGMGPENLDKSAVTSALAKRFVDRASWLLYDHQEPYYPEY